MSSDEKEFPTEERSEASTAALDEWKTHSFVLRLWCEEAQTTHSAGLWRGHITHVQSGKRRYFQQLHDVVTFISTYLPMAEHMERHPISHIARLRQWLCR